MVVVNRDGRVFYDSQGGVGVGRVSEVVRAVAEARDVRNLSPSQAQSWIVTTATALNELHRLVSDPGLSVQERRGHNDADLLEVSKHLATVDARAVCGRSILTR